jgi:hypothetical protein
MLGLQLNLCPCRQPCELEAGGAQLYRFIINKNISNASQLTYSIHNADQTKNGLL